MAVNLVMTFSTSDDTLSTASMMTTSFESQQSCKMKIFRRTKEKTFGENIFSDFGGEQLL